MQTIQGKIIKFLPKVEGESANGNHWVRAGFVIEYGDEYPTKAAFTIFGEQRLQQCAGLKEGMGVTVNFNPQSREYNDRWYTDLQCVNVFPIQQQQPAQQQPVQQQTAQTQYPYAQQQVAQQPKQPAVMQEDDGLPFD
jgi:hypothetical protein